MRSWIAGETVIVVLAGGTCEPLVGLESTPPERETAYDSDSKTDRSESKTGVAWETSDKLSSKDVAVSIQVRLDGAASA